MLNRRFYIYIILQLLLISVSIFLIVYLLSFKERFFSIFSLCIVLCAEIIFLAQYINHFNKKIAEFFCNLKSAESSYAFSDKLFKGISKNVSEDINFIHKKLHASVEKREAQESFFQGVIENAQTGLIAFDETGKTDVFNKASCQILGTHRLKNIHSLQDILPDLHLVIMQQNPGEEKLFSLKRNDSILSLSIRLSEFKRGNQLLKIVSFQNIKNELNEKESDSWHKLIRILAHEINNSLTPITSLASSLDSLFEDEIAGLYSLNPELDFSGLKQAREGLQIIEERGRRLTDFVDAYRNIADIKSIKLENFKILELFYNTKQLLHEQLIEKKISVEISVLPIDLDLKADRKYIEQIMINLIRNALYAIGHQHGKIELKAFLDDRNQVNIEVKDNGSGIKEEVLDKIFIPFFTTKEKGSGIGLSLTKQIIQLHKGEISISSKENEGSLVQLIFPVNAL